MFTDNIKPQGTLSIQLTGPDGSLKYNEQVNNLVVTTGKNWIAGRMFDTSIPDDMSHMAVGTNTTAAAAGDTTLNTESARVALTSTTISTNTTAYVATFGAGTGTGALVEAGILNAASSGTLLCRTVFSVVNKGADDTLTITWTITIN
tara:strand:- start:1428 stop:1871 length:444 start_codon:yes stop_codon:yes gene_type:complete